MPHPKGITHVWADGGVILKNPSDLGGTWAWCHTLTDLEAGWARNVGDWGYYTPSLFDQPAATNNVSELYAVVLGLEALPDGWSGTICSDSQITLERLRTWTQPPGVAVALRNVPALLQQMVWRQVQRLDWQNVRFLQLGGHPTRAHLASGTNSSGHRVSIHQVWCDAHCKAAADRFHLDRFQHAEHVFYMEQHPLAIAKLAEVDPNAPLPTPSVVKRSSQEVTPMARYVSAKRPRRIFGIVIGGSADGTSVTPS